MNYFFVTGTFFVKGGIQRGNSPLASGRVAVEQKSNDSAIYCPTSNIASEIFHSHQTAQTRSPENSEKYKSDRPKINKHIC